MKKLLSTIALCGVVTLGATYAMPNFSSDVFPWLMEKGLTKFKTEKEFRPSDAITRGEAAKFVTSYAGVIGLQGNETACTFSDTSNYDASLKDFITKSCMLGLFKGSNGKFMPNNNITEAQALTVVVRSLYGKMDETMSPWYKGYFMKAKDIGLISNETISMVDSKNITRQKLATWLYQGSTSKMMMKDTMTDKEEMMKAEEMKKKEMMEKEAMMKSAGMYKDYNMEAVKTALTEGKKVALFFHASRCPSCVTANKDFMAMKLADNSVIFKVDYDTMTDLKKQYGVTSQHTFVFLNTDMTASSVKMGLTAAQATDMLK